MTAAAHAEHAGRLEFLLRRPRLLVLAGAGCSTDSGIPDYRAADGGRKSPRPSAAAAADEPLAALPGRSHKGGMAAVGTGKRSFDIDSVLDRVEAAVAPLPKAALFQLYDEGYRSPFEQLVACIISVRTRDETTVVCARKLFALARTPGETAMLDAAVVDDAIRQSTFHEPKAVQIGAIAQEVVGQHGGELPCDFATLTGFRGVGPKCANLVLGIACGRPGIGVDVHVHRVTNRWGYVEGSSPERTMAALEAKLPARYWVDINRLLVPFGKHICTGVRPRCSNCVVLDMCRQVGVTEHR